VPSIYCPNWFFFTHRNIWRALIRIVWLQYLTRVGTPDVWRFKPTQLSSQNDRRYLISPLVSFMYILYMCPDLLQNGSDWYDIFITITPSVNECMRRLCAAGWRPERVTQHVCGRTSTLSWIIDKTHRQPNPTNHCNVCEEREERKTEQANGNVANW